MRTHLSNLARLVLLFAFLGAIAGPAATLSGKAARIDYTSALMGVVEQEKIIVRVVETEARASSSRVVVTFLNQRDRVVAVRSAVLAPGRPVQVEASGSRFGSGILGAVRVVIRIEVADLSLSQPLTVVEFFDPLSLHFRRGPTCGPGAQAVGPQVACEGIVNLTTAD